MIPYASMIYMTTLILSALLHGLLRAKRERTRNSNLSRELVFLDASTSMRPLFLNKQERPCMPYYWNTSPGRTYGIFARREMTCMRLLLIIYARSTPMIFSTIFRWLRRFSTLMFLTATWLHGMSSSDPQVVKDSSAQSSAVPPTMKSMRRMFGR
ncbi:hypothetical protein F5146DRAFT_1053292 [Armillaria mellea]|nr:hypothetical protein F5146DRAFT_1053292 [Armillaria mellea]